MTTNNDHGLTNEELALALLREPEKWEAREGEAVPWDLFSNFSLIYRLSAVACLAKNTVGLEIRRKPEPWESLKPGMLCMVGDNGEIWRKAFFGSKNGAFFYSENGNIWIYCRPCTDEELSGIGVKKLED